MDENKINQLLIDQAMVKRNQAKILRRAYCRIHNFISRRAQYIRDRFLGPRVYLCSDELGSVYGDDFAQISNKYIPAIGSFVHFKIHGKSHMGTVNEVSMMSFYDNGVCAKICLDVKLLKY